MGNSSCESNAHTPRRRVVYCPTANTYQSCVRSPPSSLAIICGNVECPRPPRVAELLIIVWGLCFIAALGESNPKLKARNFSQSFDQGKMVVTRRLSIHSSKALSPDVDQTQARVQWEADYRNSAASVDRDTSGGRAQVIGCVLWCV